MDGIPPADWLPALVPHHKGRIAAEIHPELLRFFYTDYGREDRPALQAVWERTCAAALENGWGDPPSARRLQRAFEALPKEVRTLWQKGERGLFDMLPAAQRDRSAMKPNDMWNVDARTWDLMVELPDAAGNVRRVRMTVAMVQDVASNFLLGYEIAKTESTDLYQRLLCRAMQKFGIPKAILFDNTRAAANKRLTGGSENRFRFAGGEELPGVLTRLGIKVIFATPYNGRSKPVERAFRELTERSEKHPAVAGAYTGRSPMHKPANYGTDAAFSTPSSRFLRRLEITTTPAPTAADR